MIIRSYFHDAAVDMGHNTISIFYHRDGWHHLMEAIRRYLLDPSIAASLASWHVYLGVHRGDHITVQLWPARTGEEVETAFIGYVADYLVRRPSPPALIELPVRTWFKPFQNNSIRLNVDGMEAFYSDEEVERGLRHQLSVSMTAALSNEVIDEDCAGAFALYMYSGLVRAGHERLSDAAAAVLALQCRQGGDDPSSGELQWDEKLNGIGAIIGDVWDKRDYRRPDMCWLDEWMDYCRRHLNVFTFAESFCLIGHMIRQHSGLSNKDLPQLFKKLFTEAIIPINHRYE